MKEIYGNLWDYWLKPNTGIAITTNGFIKSNGECVMGRGCALESKSKVPNIAMALGTMIKIKGNHVHALLTGTLYSFPVKHNWWEEADVKLIERSCKEISALAIEPMVVIPRPGCGNGKLKYSDVRKVLVDNLDDRFNVITWAK